MGRESEDSGRTLKDHGIKEQRRVQALFSGCRVQKLVVKHGKAVVGWDESASFREVPSDIRDSVLARASVARTGLRSRVSAEILSNGYYLDLGWPAAGTTRRTQAGGDAANLAPKKGSVFLVANRACGRNTSTRRMWTRESGQEMRAIAERLWSSQETSRSGVHVMPGWILSSARLEWLGLTHKAYYRKDASAHRRSVVAGRVLPRSHAHRFGRTVRTTPANRPRRRSRPAPRRYEPRGGCRAAAKAMRAGILANWLITTLPVHAAMRFLGPIARPVLSLARQHAQLQPLAQRSLLVKEVAARSQDLSALGTSGSCRARRHCQRSNPLLIRGSRKQFAASSNKQSKPKALSCSLHDQVPAVQRLVEAALLLARVSRLNRRIAVAPVPGIWEVNLSLAHSVGCGRRRCRSPGTFSFLGDEFPSVFPGKSVNFNTPNVSQFRTSLFVVAKQADRGCAPPVPTTNFADCQCSGSAFPSGSCAANRS